MATAPIASFEVYLMNPLDHGGEGAPGRREARKLVLTTLGLEKQASIGKVKPISSTVLAVDVKEGGDVEEIETALKTLGTVMAMNEAALQERVLLDRAWKQARLREDHGLLTGTDVMEKAMPTLMSLWGKEGTDEKRARRGDALLDMMKAGQKAAVAAQSERLVKSCQHVDEGKSEA